MSLMIALSISNSLENIAIYGTDNVSHQLLGILLRLRHKLTLPTVLRSNQCNVRLLLERHLRRLLRSVIGLLRMHGLLIDMHVSAGSTTHQTVAASNGLLVTLGVAVLLVARARWMRLLFKRT